MKMKHVTLLVAIVLLALPLAAEPFHADADTLLLAGFENSLREADYACGPLRFYGVGATFAEGYYGRGIDLRGRPLERGFEGKGAAGQSAIFKNMALFTYGNVLPDEGTFECFVFLEDAPKNPQPNHGMLMNAHVGRFIDDGKYYLGTQVRLSRGRLTWLFPVWSSGSCDSWGGSYNFRPALRRGWHHFALTWAEGEAVLWLDGRIVDTCDLKGKYGLTLFHHLNHGLVLGGHILDEVRISSVARYKAPFEPNWRDRKRPGKSFDGNPGAKRYPARYRQSPAGHFEAASAPLPGTDASLIVLEGLERKALVPGKIAERNGGFALDLGAAIHAEGKVSPAGAGVQKLALTLRNTGEKDAELECSLCVPALKDEVQLFDGADIKKPQPFETYRDSYPAILPLTAVADRRGSYRAAALDPLYPVNDLISAHKSGKGFLQGTKFVLSPGESFTLHFVLLAGKSRFGIAAALDRYYALYPKAFQMDRNNTVYHYLPLTMHWRAGLTADLQRQGYGGAYWGHGPYHTKGDETGNFWGKYPKDPSFKHALGNEKTFRSPKQLREAILVENRYEYDNGYGVRRYHANPDLSATWLMRELYPAWKPQDDPLNTGHYYKRISHQYFVNEYSNPFGDFFQKEAERYYQAGMKDLSIGWINDTVYATATMRYNGPETAKVPGRSFSKDFRHFIRGAMGKQQRWEALGKLKSRNYPMTVVADGGSFSYTLAACSAESALESGGIFESLQGWNFLRNARFLHGEKPLAMHAMPEQIDTARNIRADKLDPMLLRDAYRYNSQYVILFALENALLLDPAAYLPGRQYIAENLPLTVDAVLRGRKASPGASFTGSSWLRRSGEGGSTLLLCGNASGRQDAGKLQLYRECFDGKLPLLAPYWGGDLKQSFNAEGTAFPVSIAPRSCAAFLTLGLVDRAETASVTFTGDGIDVVTGFEIIGKENAQLKLSGFGPLYQLQSVRVNGKDVPAADRVSLAPGQNRVQAVWHNKALHFTQAEWAKVDLLNGQNAPNFAIVADPGYRYRTLFYNITLGFEYGTAEMFREFVRAYDAEDGIFNNMPLPAWRSSVDPADKKWQLVFNGKARRSGVSLDLAKRLIHIDGTTPGDCRRQAVVLLRLMDRRYPHVGMMMMPRGRKFDRRTGLNEKMFREKKVAEFFEKLSEKDFLFKPLLSGKYDALYANGTTDFSGKYTLNTAPFIYEPTFADDFVYGFAGESEQWKNFFSSNPAITKGGTQKK